MDSEIQRVLAYPLLVRERIEKEDVKNVRDSLDNDLYQDMVSYVADVDSVLRSPDDRDIAKQSRKGADWWTPSTVHVDKSERGAAPSKG